MLTDYDYFTYICAKKEWGSAQPERTNYWFTHALYVHACGYWYACLCMQTHLAASEYGWKFHADESKILLYMIIWLTYAYKNYSGDLYQVNTKKLPLKEFDKEILILL